MNEHFFVTTALHWNIDEDLFTVLKKNRKQHGKEVPPGLKYFVYKVPVSISEDYEINNFMPVVEGVELVASGSYE